MLRKAFVVGFVGAIAALAYRKLQGGGGLSRIAETARDGARRVSETPDLLVASPRPAAKPRTRSRRAAADPISQPAPAHPWPVDPLAIPPDK